MRQLKWLKLFGILSLHPLLSAAVLCPIWTNHSCGCGEDLGGVVQCDNNTKLTSLLFCNCMTHDIITEEPVVGGCLFMCKIAQDDKCIAFNRIHSTCMEDLNTEMCDSWNRTGTLCGACMPNTSLPVYSYYMGCVPCDESDVWANLFKYICVAYVPLTIFFIIIILFKISALSDSMNAYVFTCQVITVPATTKLIVRASGSYLGIVKVLLTFFSVWNLDMFRSLYNPFCLHPSLNTMQVIALDYVVAVYPMILIVITYIAVSLHDRYSLVVAVWRPMQRVLMCIRKEWNIRGSLVQALATFLVLSYVKILNTSFDLLIPVNVYTPNGSYTVHLFNDATVLYFSREHSPFAVLAIVMLFIFNITPVTVLIAYPCHLCPKVKRRVIKHELLTLFLHAFQESYKNKPKIRRQYGAIYFIARIVLLVTFAAIHNFTYIPMTGFYFIFLCMLVIFARPYNRDKYNNIDGLFFLLYAFCYFLLLTHMYVLVYEPEENQNISVILLACLLTLPVLYGSWILLKLIIPKVVWDKIKIYYAAKIAKKSEQTAHMEDAFPARLETEEHTPLLNNTQTSLDKD